MLMLGLGLKALNNYRQNSNIEQPEDSNGIPISLKKLVTNLESSKLVNKVLRFNRLD
jgi:predicted transcriptional regulator